MTSADNKTVALQNQWPMIALILATGLIAAFAFQSGKASLVEAIAFVSGAICVWLVVRRSIWNFPLGLINVVASAYVFYEYDLFADSGLQIVYFVLNGLGWWMWLRGGPDTSPLKVTNTGTVEKLLIGVFIAASTIALYFILDRVGGAAKFWDALTTSISLGAQWLLSRKKVESWLLWILVDIIYVPLYVSRDLYLMAILYAIFLVMAVIGYFEWRKARAS